MSKKILIIGNSAKEYALAKALSEKNEVFVAPGSVVMQDFATCLDIREDSISELLDFVLENDVELTIPISIKSINTNIVEVFQKNNQEIFAPSEFAAKQVFDKIGVKKLLYKLRIPTPKFGIFEKQNVAMDYIKNLKNPFVVKTPEKSSSVILTSKNTAKTVLDAAFLQKNQKVLIEDYIWGTPFVFYVISDGYKALPITSSILYEHSLEGNGGQLTDGMGACVPNYKFTLDNEEFMMSNVVYPLLDYLEVNKAPYLGILGIKGVLSEAGDIQIVGFEPFFQNCDSAAAISLMEEDLIKLMQSCIVGSFSDEYDYIAQKDCYASSVVLNCNSKINKENVISGIENLDELTQLSFYSQIKKNRYLEFEADYGPVMVVTSLGKTVAKSTANVYEEQECITFAGKYYRKDICKSCNFDI